jgi:hypothetical protein
MKISTEKFKNELYRLLRQIETAVELMPYKGDKCEDSQRICLIQAINELEHTINGISDKDLVDSTDNP